MLLTENMKKRHVEFFIKVQNVQLKYCEKVVYDGPSKSSVMH